MDTRDLSAALPHAVFAVATTGVAAAHASRTATGVVVETWLPLVLAAALLYAGWRFRALDPTENQVVVTAALLCGGGLYGAGFVTFIQFLQLRNGVVLVFPYYMVAMAGAGGATMATVIAHYYVGYAKRVREARTESERSRRLQKQASVLNRTLRHNLKNELQVIGGWLDEAFRAVDADTQREHRIVRDHLADLEAASERARLIDRVLRTDELATVDIADSVEDAARAVDGEVSVDGDVPATAPAVAHPEVRAAIEEAFRNAIEHNDTADLTVRASVSLVDRADGDPVWALDIVDTGDGIPAVEIEALQGAAEGPLEHGRGLGLYLIQTVVAQSGGDLSIRQGASDDDGTTVRMLLPVADEHSVDDRRTTANVRDTSGTVLTDTEEPSLD